MSPRRAASAVVLTCAMAGFSAAAEAPNAAPTLPPTPQALAAVPQPIAHAPAPASAVSPAATPRSQPRGPGAEKAEALARALLLLGAGAGGRPFPGLPID